MPSLQPNPNPKPQQRQYFLTPNLAPTSCCTKTCFNLRIAFSCKLRVLSLQRRHNDGIRHSVERQYRHETMHGKTMQRQCNAKARQKHFLAKASHSQVFILVHLLFHIIFLHFDQSLCVNPSSLFLFERDMLDTMMI